MPSWICLYPDNSPPPTFTGLTTFSVGLNPVKLVHGLPSLNLITHSCFSSIMSTLVQPIYAWSSDTVTSNISHSLVFWSSQKWEKNIYKMYYCNYSLQEKYVRMIGLWGKIPECQHDWKPCWKSHILKSSVCLHSATLGPAAWPIMNILVSHP